MRSAFELSEALHLLPGLTRFLFVRILELRLTLFCRRNIVSRKHVVALGLCGFVLGLCVGISEASKNKRALGKAKSSKKVLSAAAAYGLSRPPKWAALSKKTRAFLLRGKVEVKTKWLKNERGKKKMVAQCRGIIKAPPRKVFQTLADLNNAHKFIPGMYYSKIQKKLGPNRYHVFRKVKVAWVKISLHLEIQLTPHRRYQFRLMRHLKNGIKDSVGAMTFEPIQGGKHTLFSYRSYADSGRYVPGFIRRSVLGRSLPNLVRHIAKRTHNPNWQQK